MHMREPELMKDPLWNYIVLILSRICYSSCFRFINGSISGGSFMPGLQRQSVDYAYYDQMNHCDIWR
ncbi:hypothetical protein A9970_02920 [Sphingobacterium sp. UME9]|nr:hypothetical protein [Sphingobacterium sp. UME9]